MLGGVCKGYFIKEERLVYASNVSGSLLTEKKMVNHQMCNSALFEDSIW